MRIPFLTYLFQNASRTYSIRAATLLVFIPVWIFFITPYLLRIPSDFSYSANVVSVDNFYDQKTQSYSGEQYSNTIFRYDIVKRQGSIYTIKNTFEVRSPDGKLIFKTAPLYGIDSVTGKHVSGYGDMDREGYLFAPRWLKPTDEFTYWHADSSQPGLMNYVQDDYIYGLHVYVYETNYGGPIDQTKNLEFLPDVPEKKGVKLESINRLWIEPISGYLVKQEDFSKDYYFYDIRTGERLSPYNKFSNTFSEETVKQNAQHAAYEKARVIAITIGVPIVLVMIFALSLCARTRRFKELYRLIVDQRVALFILIGTVSISIGIAVATNNEIKSRQQALLQQQTDDVVQLLSRRFDRYIQALLGAKGFFEGSSEVSRSEWHAYVSSLGIDKNLPGVLGLGYSKALLPSQRNALIEHVRQEGFPTFTVWPKSDQSFLTSILYLEPFNERNQRAFGYDMLTEPVRRSAMLRARDLGEPAASGKVTLVQEKGSDVQPGFLIYVPLYSKGTSNTTPQERSKHLLGYAYSPFRMNDVMDGVIGTKKLSLDFHIYDGLRQTRESLMYDYRHDDTEDIRDPSSITYRKVVTFTVLDHPWTIEFINDAEYRGTFFDRWLAWIVLLAGVIMSLLLSGIVATNVRSKKRALSYADEVTAHLKENVDELEGTKKAMLNILEDVEDEKTKAERVTERLSLATQAANISVWEWNVGSNSLVADDNFRKIFGSDFSGEQEGPFSAWLSGIAPEDRSRAESTVTTMINDPQADFDLKYRFTRQNGTSVMVRTIAHAQRDNTGKAVRLIGVNYDISKEAEIDRAKTEFVSLASHQLKTPVGAVKWDIEMLLAGDYGKLLKKQKEVLSEVYGLNQRMSDLINDFLNISRIELGTFMIKPVPTDFVAVCNDVLTELKERIATKKHIVTEQFQDSLPELVADPHLLRIIFQNLLSNAIKYTGDGGRIGISIGTDTKTVTISVSNNGVPIPKEEQSKIFSKMFRASGAQEMDPEGNGLGLYLLKQIVETAGGTIWFESEAGKDTIFNVRFSLPGMKKKEGTRALD